MMLGSGGKTDPVYIDDIFGINLWDSHTDRNEKIFSGVKLGNANKGASVYFNGSDYKDYISIAANSDFQMGTGDFTVEMWIWVDSGDSMTDVSCWRAIFSMGGYQESGGVTVYAPRETSPADTVVVILDAVNPTIGSTTDIKDNSWHHVALVKNSGTSTLYIDGTSEGSVSDSNNYNYSGAVTVGRDNNCISGGYNNSYFQGFISNLRVTKGQALYTSNFTPSTEALTTTSQGATASNVKLLCFQSAESFWDVTKSPATPETSWTPGGDEGGPVAVPFGPFTGDDGKGGFIWHKRRTGSGGFGWNVICDSVRGANYGVYPNSSSSGGVLTGAPNASVFCNGGFIWGSENNFQKDDCEMVSWSFAKQAGFVDVVEYTGNATARDISHSLKTVPGMILLKTSESIANWVVYHKDTGNESQGYLDLTNIFSSGNTGIWDSTTPTATSFRVGANANTNANSTKYIAYLFAGGESTDATATSVDMNTDGYLSVPASSDYAFGTGAYTIEMWIYYESSVDYCCLFEGRPDSSNGAYTVIPLYGNGQIGLYKSATGASDWYIAPSSATELPKGQWTHVAVVREGTGSNQTKIYFNGRQVAQGTDDEDYDQNQGINFPRHAWTTTSDFVGKFSNYRVVKGTAVYTTNFKVTTTPLTNITNTKLLCCQGSSVTDATVIATGSITSASHATNTPQASTDSPFYDSGQFVFGEGKDQQIIACGSHKHDSTDAVRIYTGWEPEFVMCKNTESTSDWLALDTIRGATASGLGAYSDGQYIAWNSDGGENAAATFTPHADGFTLQYALTAANPGNGDKIVWMAIRRPDGGVRKPVTNGHSVFALAKGRDTTEPASNYVSNFPVDMGWHRLFGSTSFPALVARIMGGKYLRTDDTTGQDNASWATFDRNTAYITNNQDDTHMAWIWNRHAGFDCQTFLGNSVAGRGIPHSLGQVPQMVWVKQRTSSTDWMVYHYGLNGGTNPEQYYQSLTQTNSDADDATVWNDTAPTSTHVIVGSHNNVNNNGEELIMMCFASVDGVCKVGYYGGSDSDINLDLGFSPRFILIKRCDWTHANAHWYYFDTMRGINGSSGNDPYLLMDSNEAPTTNENRIEPYSSGSEIGITIKTQMSGTNYEAGERFIYYAHA